MSDITGAMLGWGGSGIASTEQVLERVAPEHRERLRQALRMVHSRMLKDALLGLSSDRLREEVNEMLPSGNKNASRMMRSPATKPLRGPDKS